MRIAIFTIFFLAAHGFLVPGSLFFGRPAHGQNPPRLLEFLETHASHESNTVASGVSKSATHAATTCLLYGSGLPGPAPFSTTLTSTEVHTNPLESAASPKPTSMRPSPKTRSQALPADPGKSSVPRSPESARRTQAAPSTSSAPSKPVSKSEDPANLSFYKSLFGLPSQLGTRSTTSIKRTEPHSSTRSIPRTIAIPGTTVKTPKSISRITASPTSKPKESPNSIRKTTSNPNSLPLTPPNSIRKTSSSMPAKSLNSIRKTTSTSSKPVPSKISSRKVEPVVVTSVITPDARCPYPYPGIYCGKMKTTLITETIKTKAKRMTMTGDEE